jgi:hypothetical protein
MRPTDNREGRQLRFRGVEARGSGARNKRTRWAPDGSGGRPKQEATRAPKDPRFGGVEKKLTWHHGTHELGRRIGKLLQQLVF